MIHPEIGLPFPHFQVWWMPLPSTTFSKQDLANNGDWELVETVGLPITQDWHDTNYSRDLQGPVSSQAKHVKLHKTVSCAVRRVGAGHMWKSTAARCRLGSGPMTDVFLDQLREGRI